MKDAFKLPFLVKGDIDGFFGLMVDNLVQLLLIIFLCSPHTWFGREFLL